MNQPEQSPKPPVTIPPAAQGVVEEGPDVLDWDFFIPQPPTAPLPILTAPIVDVGRAKPMPFGEHELRS